MKHNRIGKVLPIIVLALSGIMAVGADQKNVADINITGLKRVKSQQVLRIITLKKGEPYHPGASRISRRRLEKTGAFNQVEIITRESGKGVTVMIRLKEKPGIFSLGADLHLHNSDPFFFTEECTKFNIGLRLFTNDFSLHQHQVTMSVAYGALTEIGASYRKGFMGNYYLFLEAHQYWFNSNTFNADLTKQIVTMRLEKRLENLSLSLWGEYSNLYLENQELDYFDPLKLVKLGFSFKLDTRNMRSFPTRGFSLMLGAHQTYNHNLSIHLFTRYVLGGSWYAKGFLDHILAFNFRGVYTEGEQVPFNERVYFGGYQTLRTIPVRDEFGVNLFVGSLEYRIPLAYFDKHLVMGTAVYLFADFGTLSGLGSLPSLKRIRTNSGIGMVLVTRSFILRFDLGIVPRFRMTVGSGWKF